MYKADECSIEKLFNAVASGDTRRISQLHFSEKHLTTRIRISPPQLPVYVDYGTAFHLAACMGHAAMLRFLCEKLKIFEEARVEEQKKLEASNPRLAIFNINHGNLIPYMWCYDNNGNTPLTLAVSYEHYDATLALLNMNPDVNRKKQVSGMSSNSSNYEYTPLYLAAMSQNEKICALLLEHGADPNVIIGSQGSALHKIIQDIAKNPGVSSRIIDLLLFYGGNPYIFSGKKIRVAQLFEAKNNNQKEMILKPLVGEQDSDDEDEVVCRNKFNKDPHHYRNSARCVIIEDGVRKALFGGNVEYFLCMYSGPSAIELAESMGLDAISHRLSAYGKATSASLALLKYARILFNTKGENNLTPLLKPLIILILLHSANAFDSLTPNQANACLSHAKDKSTLTATKLSYLQKNVFSFFKEKIPLPEDLLLSQYKTNKKI